MTLLRIMFSFLFINMSPAKWLCACIGAITAFFAPVQHLVMTAFEFILVDFLVGVWASRARAKRAGKLDSWGLESRKAWHTVYKLVFVIVGIVLAHHIDDVVLPFVDMNLPDLFCGFVCGVEFWSFLENAACISDHPLFRWLKRFMGKKVKEVTGENIEELMEDDGK